NQIIIKKDLLGVDPKLYNTGIQKWDQIHMQDWDIQEEGSDNPSTDFPIVEVAIIASIIIVSSIGIRQWRS
ncbi:MAG: hypothetical protein ACW99A_03545, partial [Candidatus Kariarchaeaceae archaeon]